MLLLKSKIKSILNHKISQSILSRVIFILVKFIGFTARVEYRGVDKIKNCMKDGKPVILVFWHSRSFMITKFWNDNLGMKSHPVYGIFSTHRDGVIVGKVFRLLGVKNIASSSKSVIQASNVVMKSMRLLKSGVSIGFTPDGPVGPRMKFVSDSAFLFAKASGAPVVPVCISSFKPILLNSWDRFMVVRPFHKVIVEVGNPLFIDKKVSDSEFLEIKSEFERKMVDDTLRLDKEAGMPVILPQQQKQRK